ncbi:LysR family transcriptional regulator [Vibrio sp. 10N.261.55.A7]|uniref:LysR family transcriptional regulator n=1 Tax=Vibrio sp. 10N.261.55.A7 TaxID=1880851 RepID=UPI000C85BFB1|nr:LysR family transcriptional regulator [Vibrio sp. 10N.261.55.A7]PMK04245.1 LysR family transcriptional regulator [Vibrio sp. 10N.261.55.A7]
MDIDQIKAFCQLAVDGNYRVASEKLCITQSALTKKIQRLEESVNTELFERGRRGASLTLAGKVLLQDANRIVAQFSNFQALSSLVAKGTVGHLNIGFGISTYHLAPSFIAAFKQQFEGIKITLNDIPSQVQNTQLCQGDLHLSFNRMPVESPLVGFPLFSDQLVLAIHEEEINESVNLEENVNENFNKNMNKLWESIASLNYLKLNSERGPGLISQIERYLVHQKRQLNAEQESDDILTLLALVSARIGYTIVPASVKQISPPNIRFVPLSGKESHWQVGLIWNQQTMSPLVQQFVDFVQSEHHT